MYRDGSTIQYIDRITVHGSPVKSYRTDKVNGKVFAGKVHYPQMKIPAMVLGHGDGMIVGYDFVVAHNQKTAMLHRHIKSVVDVYYDSDLLPDEYDLIDFDDGYKSRISYGAKCLVIETGSEIVTVSGHLGSCCHTWLRDGDDDLYIWTLYDLLGRLCRDTKRNIMKYDKVIICSRMRRCMAFIEFYHDDEANRYFAKMYMDTARA